jgi:hypothetical protein
MSESSHLGRSVCPDCGQIDRPDGCRSRWHDDVPGDLLRNIWPERNERRALERILEAARLHEARDRPERRLITTNWLIEVCEEALNG